MGLHPRKATGAVDPVACQQAETPARRVGRAEQHAIAANFPDTGAFSDAYIRWLMEAWHPRLPVLPLFAGIVQVAADIYDLEGFNNPIAPIPADPIDQGRWRDELRIHTRKMHDAPGTLAVFSAVLTLTCGIP